MNRLSSKDLKELADAKARLIASLDSVINSYGIWHSEPLYISDLSGSMEPTGSGRTCFGDLDNRLAIGNNSRRTVEWASEMLLLLDSVKHTSLLDSMVILARERVLSLPNPERLNVLASWLADGDLNAEWAAATMALQHEGRGSKDESEDRVVSTELGADWSISRTAFINNLKALRDGAEAAEQAIHHSEVSGLGKPDERRNAG